MAPRFVSTARCFLAFLIVAGTPASLWAAEDVPANLSLFEKVRAQGARASVVGGRIQLVSPRSNGTSSYSSSGNDFSERLTFGRNMTGLPTVDYTRSDSQRDFAVRVSNGVEARIRLVPKDNSKVTAMEFVQSAGRPIEFTIGAGQESRTYRAAGLWHFMLLHPPEVSARLLPLISVLNKDWELEKRLEQIEAALLETSVEDELRDRARWDELIRQLADDRFSQRESADRELREIGQVALAHLERLDRETLDAEQFYRVRRIVQALAQRTDTDSPQHVARRLAGDPAVWLVVLSRDDEAARKTALHWLESLLEKPIEFDSAADPQTRAEQLARLRRQILGK